MEPQGNSQDYLLQDYNVVDVEEATLEELPAYDLSGPEYAGITEIVSDNEYKDSEAVTEKKPTIYLSTYHTDGDDSYGFSKQTLILKSPTYANSVYSAVKDTQYGKAKKVTPDGIGAFLRSVYKLYQNNGPSMGSELNDSDFPEIQKILGATEYSGLWRNGLLSHGYACHSCVEYEQNVVSITQKLLEDSGYPVVITPSSGTNALDFELRMLESEGNGAVIHVVVCVQVTRYDLTDGRLVLYNDRDSEDKVASLFAAKLAEKLKSHPIPVHGDGCYGTKELSGDSELCPALNWGTTPKVALVMGRSGIFWEDNAVSKSENHKAFADGIAAAVLEMFPITPGDE